MRNLRKSVAKFLKPSLCNFGETSTPPEVPPLRPNPSNIMTTARINRAIKFLGLQIIKGQGYSYFLDANGDQIGESVMVYALNHMPLEKWVEAARGEWERHHAAHLPFTLETVREVLTLAGDGQHALAFLNTAATTDRDPVELWELTKPFRDNPFQP